MVEQAKTVGARSSSYARDHLANERTFLAWLRTSVALMSFGIFIVKLRYLFPAAPQAHGAIRALQLGLIFAVLGLVMIAFALQHYFATRRGIDENSFQPAGAGVVAFAVAIAGVGVAIIIYLLTSPAPVAAQVSVRAGHS